MTSAWQESDPAELAHLQMGPRALSDCRDKAKLGLRLQHQEKINSLLSLNLVKSLAKEQKQNAV